MERIHLPTDPKQRELSRINNTLYEFLLAAEEKPVEDKVTSHVILKADIRDSTGITAQLFARNLNPASYFSLGFFDPVGKFLPRYGATKVFLEGDAPDPGDHGAGGASRTGQLGGPRVQPRAGDGRSCPRRE